MSKLSVEQAKLYLSKVPGWRLIEERMALTRTYQCRDFSTAVSLVNRVAELLEQDSRHVEILIQQEAVTFTVMTKEARGLTGKDFALAQTISKVS
ncbi:4a-hydroxytetrahydrobiopterin dehydratase [Brevibacillus ruminantium]|uniref:4a-hydroxytetrahydrobiopterin dehydratase n=1 Tax=Brevibacillus ruminantium TaxID=2950604 RepID=A0ABY4W9D6_9BACL|nr:4a-hydroxytetrahydrobiopterin dehydratase [Brevibacillus ruminantium]USG63792.1 4a-hydroxytetrahydrobiopterin dehydratase [Brevibacillus ruminantium]